MGSPVISISFDSLGASAYTSIHHDSVHVVDVYLDRVTVFGTYML